MKKATVIVNPVAGKMKIHTNLFSLLRSLGKQNYETTVYITKSKNDATDAAKRYAEVSDLIVCCGGDGTLNEVISGLLNSGSKPRLLYYPCGSTNDFAATLGLPKRIDAVTLRVDDRAELDLDIGVLNGVRHFTYIASFGIFTRASFAADQKTKNILGHLAYVFEGAKELPDLNKSYYTKITYDGGVLEGRFAFVAVTNTTSIGGAVKLPSDRVKLNDGYLEIVLVKAMPTAVETTTVLNLLLQQKFDDKNIYLLHTKAATIECPDAPVWCVDGEYGGEIAKAKVNCLPGAIRILR